MKRPLLMVCICLVMFMSIWTGYHDTAPFAEDFPAEKGEYIILTGQIYQKEQRSYYGTDKIYLYLKSIAIINSETGQVSNQNPIYKVICEMKKGSGELPLGKVIRVAGNWQPFAHASNPGAFDEADYYAAAGIVGKLKDCSVVAVNAAQWPVRENLYQLRTILKDRLYQAMPRKEASILAKMLLGEKSGVNEAVKELYQRNGIVHILSISGLHITMIGMGIYKLLRKGSCPVIPAALAGGILLLLYGTMTGFGISACRAIGMYLVHMLGEITGRSYDMMTAMGILMAGMVCSNPRLLGHCGFLLSFGSVCGIGCLYPALSLPAPVIKKRAVPPPLWIRVLLKRLGGVLQGLLASLSVSLFTLPIVLYFFYEIPLYSPFVNLLVLPFMGAVMVMGFVMMVFPGIPFVPQLEHIILNGYERVCLLFEKLPAHTLPVGCPKPWKIGVYYPVLLGIIWLSSLNGRGNKKKWWLAGILPLVLLLMMNPRREDSISFLSVGQGDCIVLLTQTGGTYLFDGGSSTEKTVGKDMIQPFLKYHGVDTLDGVFLSHSDKDHMNGVVQLLKEELVEIKRIYLPDAEEAWRNDFEELLEVIPQASVGYYAAGDYLQEGELRITCLYPSAGFSGDGNIYSGCFLVEKGDWRVLLTADVEGIGEQQLAQCLQERGIDKVQVLKVAHHGSKYSTGQEFLDTVTARLAVISCGEENQYGHPHKETLERLTTAGVPFCITWESGCVSVTEEGYRFWGS